VNGWLRPGRARRAALGAAEVLAAVGLATAVVALLDRFAPTTGLGVVYLLAVLWTAIRRGGAAALCAAVISVLALNYFFIAPIHRLTIASRQNVAALGVFLIAAVVVGRLASAARERAAEADSRARLAERRERDAALLAEAAAAVLAGPSLPDQLRRVAASVARATGAPSARIELEATASPHEGERAVRLPLSARSGWLYLPTEWAGEIERLPEPLARILDVALERRRLGDQAAEQEAVRRAGIAQTAVLHAISHDLRSPLTGITAAAGALQDPAVGPLDRHELVEVIATDAARLSRMVDDLLDLSRIQAGAVNPREDWCDLDELVAGAAELVRAARGEHPIEIALPSELPLVRADAAQLERVFANLIENAVKFSPPDAPVRITGGTGGGKVVVRVSDRGRGVPLSQRGQIFEPFFRTRGREGGTGLGLAITRGFVEANGGAVVVQSPPDGGTSFAVSFSLVAQPAPAP